MVLARHEAAFEAQAPFEMDYRLQRADGEFRWMSAHAVPRFDAHGGFAGYIGTCVDITERRRAEEMRQRLEAQLRQSQKMEAMGTLAGGIAHDFNNLLAAIGGNLALVAMDLGKSHPAQENLGEMRRAVHRATELVKRILTFSRPETHEQEPVQLGPVVIEAVHLLRSLIPAGIELSHHVAPDLPDVLANASQVHQVIVNLATNAWQAMDGGPGRIDIRLDAWAVDQAMVDSHGELRPGPYVCVAVEDTGQGMAPATIERIFEPFFTTKSPGKGTGLGLSMVHGIARGHGGTVLVESELRKGSTFRVLFPACADVATDEPELPAVPHELRGDGEWILYLDDEEPLVKLAVSFLERLGYRVSGYTRVEEALAAFRAQPDAFDLVVTDYNMPAMSGMDVALTVMSLRPSVIVALASGYLRPAEAEHARGLGIRATIRKPYTLEELGEVVQRLLHARHTQTLTHPRAAARVAGAPTMTACHAHRAGRVRLSIAARRGGAARRPQPRDRAERQRQVQPVSSAAPARRRGAGARRLRRWRRRAACRRCCGPGRSRSRGRCKAGLSRGPGHAAQGPDQPEARVRVGRLRLRHRSRAAGHRAAACSTTIPRSSAKCVWSGAKLRPSAVLVDRRGPFVRVAGRWRLADADAGPGQLRQHDDALRRSAEHAGDAAAARVDPRLALLRSLPHRCRLAGAPAADRHAHAGARPRRPRSRGGARDDPR